VLVPDVLEEGLLRQDLAGSAHEVAQEGELLGREVEATLAPAGLVAGVVELELAHPHDRAPGARVAAQQRPHPGQQLGEGERLHEVVVGAVVEPRHAVVEAVPCGQHQHARLHLERLGPQLPAHLAPVRTGHGDVEADQVVGVDERLGEGLVAVVGHVDRVAVAPQPSGDGLGQLLLVVDDQHSHAARRYRPPARPRRQPAYEGPAALS